ncbi:potassium-transporting ATPase subunit C [Nocardia stercoris]|uniref:Potassium-transporting ATPase KdpC subunit n=1 Tax=Nocardia stercoris TaxID=2483361 RepID=A0A3M2LDE3_9NOCA|nr:potassium-transporting ATPase subunit C [Nocardia stercoris]
MRMSSWIRQHLAAVRALLVLTVITGIIYPLVVFGIGQLPGLRDKANGSLITANGQIVGSSLIGQAYTDGKGTALPQYFQTRPSNAQPAAVAPATSSAIPDGYDPTNSSFGNQGPESVVDTLDASDPAKDKFALLTTVCQRSAAVAALENVDGSRPFCAVDSGSGNAFGSVLAVLGPRDSKGNVTAPTQVVSVNQACAADGKPATVPFLDTYAGVKVVCATRGQDYSAGLIVPIKGNASVDTPVPADAVTASASGLDPQISPRYAEIQVARVASARGVSEDKVRALVAGHTSGRALGFMGEPAVNVVELNADLDNQLPYTAAPSTSAAPTTSPAPTTVPSTSAAATPSASKTATPAATPTTR